MATQDTSMPSPQTGSTILRDMRYKQGNFTPKASSGGGLLDYIAKPAEDFIKGFTGTPGTDYGNDAANFGDAVANATPGGHEVSGLVQSLPKIAGVAMGAVKTGETVAKDAETVLPKMPNFLTRTGEAIKSDIGKVIAPDASKNIYGSVKTQQIQNALRRNNVDNYTQLPQAADRLFQQKINPELSVNPKQVNLDDISNSIVGEMRKLKPGLDLNGAQQAAKRVMIDMYNSAREGTDNPVPTSIDTPSIFKIKTDLNNTEAVNNYFKGNPISSMEDLATIGARNALGKIISDAHPTIAEATRDYGLLKEAVPSLFKASQQGRGIGINVKGFNVGIPSALGGPIRDMTGGALRTAGKIADSPAGKILGPAALITAGAAGYPIVKNAINQYNQDTTGQADYGVGGNSYGETTPNSNVAHSDSLVQKYGFAKADNSGNIPLPKQTAPSGQYYTYSDFLGDTKGMSPNSPQYGAAHQRYTDSISRAQEYFKGNNKQNFMDNAQNYVNDAYSAKDSFVQVPPTLLNKLKTWQNVQTYINGGGQYAQQLQQLSQFNTEYASAYQDATGSTPTKDQLLDPALPPKALSSRWASMVDNMNKWYKQNLDPYLAVTTSSTVQTPQGQPIAPQYPSGARSQSNVDDLLQSNSQLNNVQLPSIQ